MNRWKWELPTLKDGETRLGNETNVTLYDGDQKTSRKDGDIIVTSHRIIWCPPGEINQLERQIALQLSKIRFIEEETPGSFSFSRSRKLLLHLYDLGEDDWPGDFSSYYNFSKLSIRGNTAPNLTQIVHNALEAKQWLVQPKKAMPEIKLRTGIAGIERHLEERQRAADKSISVAFQDLSQLMSMAKDMVKLSNTISSKIKDKQGDITEDETVRFKSYLLSLGIDDPVTRNDFKSDNQYYRSLAMQISDALESHIREMGGMMALTDAFCRINRARGLELLSPEDVMNACLAMDSLNLALRLHVFKSGVKVLKLATLDDDTIAANTAELLADKHSLTAEELARTLGISITLAKERLLITEKLGKSCRDDSIEGLRFYPNLFVNV